MGRGVQVTSVGFEIEGSCHPEKVQKWLGELLQTQGQDIYRSKGILAMDGDQDRCALLTRNFYCHCQTVSVPAGDLLGILG